MKIAFRSWFCLLTIAFCSLGNKHPFVHQPRQQTSFCSPAPFVHLATGPFVHRSLLFTSPGNKHPFVHQATNILLFTWQQTAFCSLGNRHLTLTELIKSLQALSHFRKAFTLSSANQG